MSYHDQKSKNELSNICILIIVTLVVIVTIIMVGGKYMIKIDSDKVLNVNGKRIFPVYMYSICNTRYEMINAVEHCDPSSNKEFLFGMSGVSTIKEFNALNYKNLYEQALVYYTLNSLEIDDIPQYLIDSPYFFGYVQPDEPSNDDMGKISDAYDKIKAKDQLHVILLNHYRDMVLWYPYTDIITWDIYPIRSGISFVREDAMYLYERWSDDYFFNGTNLNSIDKPVWAVVQANGVVFEDLLVPTRKEARCNTYTAITMDIKGIGYWGYKSYGGPDNTSGLYKNIELHKYYKQLAREIVSLNNILILPTLDYSWQYYQGTNVKFSRILIRQVLGEKFTNFNYILKREGRIYYLIVVNKDPRSVSNVTLNITGIIGKMKIVTLGLEKQGSGRYGRTILGVNGKFNDNFDGYAVHIYKILT